ncbi:uncharacterized protein LOC123313774 [Coccinella septempunctata]|uniref:uncharacterized protein LOC123313774 n=1 Tax=Coccinella septempunctata TaxID=41139 RepID=UPI001D07C6DA|nr:uncharacterized protein LOC123313774 [Coccinella septempunctata]
MPSSSIASHKMKNLNKAPSKMFIPEKCKLVIRNAENSDFLKNFYKFGPQMNFKCPQCIVTYNELGMFDSLNVCMMTETNKALWEQERKFRVTGSRCYDLYTYSKNDWEEKCRSYFYPKQFSSVYTRHGIKYEPLARDIFEKTTGLPVLKMGLIMCRSEPWLAYSADGIIFKNDEPYGLLEIKCPYKAKNTSDVVQCCRYILEENGVHVLKKRHKYFAQVQLGMAILNLKICHFIVFFSSDNTYLDIRVPFDEEYAHSLLFSLKQKYLDNMLHYICSTS